MSVSKLTKKDYVSDDSCRFFQLPDEVIVTILKKSGGTKALIRCSSVCKHLQSLVSKVDTVSFTFSYPGEEGDYLPCWGSHVHIPSPIPALMKVFANLTSLKIKLCLCPSLLPPYVGLFGKSVFKFQLKAVNVNDKMQTNLCMAFEVGLLSSDDEGMLSRKLNVVNFVRVQNSLMKSFFQLLLSHVPKSLRSVVILSAGIMGYKPALRSRPKAKEVYRSGGSVFMESEQLVKFRALNSTKKMHKSWLENPHNLVCWVKKHDENEHRLGEKVWLIHKWEGERCNLNKSTVEERDVEELLRAFDDNALEKLWNSSEMNTMAGCRVEVTERK